MDTKNRSLFEMEAARLAREKQTESIWNKFLYKLTGIAFGASIGILVMLIVMVPLTIYTMFAHGYVAMKIWQWYIVPTFNVAPITWVVGGGIMLLVRLFTYTTSTAKTDTTPLKEKVITFIGSLLVPWYSLLIAWAFHRILM